MKKDSLSYEIGVLMAIGYIRNNDVIDSAEALLNCLEDEEIIDDMLLRGIKDEVISFYGLEAEDEEDSQKIDKYIRRILETYELNLNVS